MDNGGDALTLTADGAFRFATPVLADAVYAVTVGTQPNWYDCTVRNGSARATADVTSVSVACAPAPARVTTLAGSGASGHADGIGHAASFFQPTGVAADADGTVYVADSVNQEIRKITPDGVVSTLAGSFAARGTADGIGIAASFNGPTGVAVRADGNVYVADFANQKIRAITPNGVVTTLAGHLPPGAVDGAGTAAAFNGPFGVSVDASGNLYVADQSNNEIRKITPAGMVSTLAGSTAAGSADGVGANASFLNPFGVAVDADGTVYVADSFNHRIRKITPAGAVSTLAGSAVAGSADGTGANASFNVPTGIAVDASRNLYVADLNNNSIRRITPAGVVSTLAGSSAPGFADGIGAAAAFQLPTGVTVDADGNLYVADWKNHAIRKITPVRQ